MQPPVDLNNLNDRVQAIIRLAPDALLSQEALRITREFCDFTRAWQFEADPITIIVNTSDYDVQVPDINEAEPIAVTFMTVDQVPCNFRDTEWLDSTINNWRKRPTNDFRYFTQFSPQQFTFPCVPTSTQKANGCYYRVALKPTISATTIDGDFYNRWADVLTIGVRAALYSMEGQAWANAKAAQNNEALYQRERMRARIRVENSYGNPHPKMMVPAMRFAGK